MDIVIGSDCNGYELKGVLIAYLRELGHTVTDIGVGSSEDSTIYPDVALALALKIRSGEFARGILICGTGLGMAITANKVPGVFAACCHDPYSAERARTSNDAQIITMGAQIVAPTLAKVLLDHWLASEYAAGRSAPKVDRMREIDDSYNATPR